MADGNAADEMGSEQERERRLDALRQLAGEQGGTTPVAAPQLRQVSGASGRRRPLVALGLVALLVCVVVAGAAVYVTHRGSPRTTASPIERVIVSDGALGCVFGAQYAPDGKTLAVLAGAPITNVCYSTNGPSSYPTSLILYDVASMRPTQSIELANTVLAKAKAPTGMHIVGGIGLRGNFLWSADSQRIAVFWAGNLAPLGSTQIGTEQQNGLAIITTGTQAVQVISASSEPDYPSNSSIDPSSYIPTWSWLINLSAETMKPVRMPQALAYQWQADDSVAVHTPMPTSPDTAPAISSDGSLTPYGTTFSMWQGASVSEVSGPCVPAYFQVQMGDVVAWSPDGNAVFASGFANSRLSTEVPPVPTPTAIPGAPPIQCTAAVLANLPTPDHLAFIAPRDQGVPEALRLIKPDPNDANQSDVSGFGFTWSPDGRRLAVTPNSISGDVTSYVAIYDSASGRQLAQYSVTKLDPFSKTGGSQPLFLNLTWSPDGKTLLAEDTSTLILIRV